MFEGGERMLGYFSVLLLVVATFKEVILTECYYLVTLKFYEIKECFCLRSVLAFHLLILFCLLLLIFTLLGFVLVQYCQLVLHILGQVSKYFA